MDLCDICRKNPAFVFIKSGNEKRITRFCAECHTAQKEPGPQSRADQPSAPLASVPAFPRKPQPRDSSRSDGEGLQRASLRTNRPANFARGPGSAAVLIAAPPRIDFGETLARLKDQIEKGKKTLYEAAMKAEDLEAIIQGLRRTHERIAKKRR